MDSLGQYSSGSDSNESSGDDSSCEADIPQKNEDSGPAAPAVSESLVALNDSSGSAKGNSAKELEPPSKKRRLPSSTALLSGAPAKPSFLAKESEAVFEIPLETSKSEPSLKAPPKVEKDSADGNDFTAKAVPAGQMNTEKTGGMSAAKKAQEAQKKEKEKADVKDKLKAARLKGQSAHARWKSEGEMLLRQQYD